MSYDLTGYKLKNTDSKESVALILNGEVEDVEEYDGLIFTDNEKSIIDQCLLREHGFEKRISDFSIDYEKRSSQISVFEDQIGIAVPYWKNAENDLKEVFEIIKQISAQTEIIFWDPQMGELITDEPDSSLEIFDSMVSATQTFLSQENSFKPTPWWKFWQ